jgi:SagB-type dehydrogenase family enzyme
MFRTAIVSILLLAASATAGDIQLSPPQTDGGKPLMQALKERKSTREFSSEKLSDQMLSNLLWAAFGVNRPDGRRTAPSARNWQEIDIYVTLAGGVYIYDAREHKLRQISADDHRAATGIQDFVKDAALNLVYVADLKKTGSSEEQNLFVAADAGFIGQNVYLFCASEGLGTVVRGLVNREALAKVLKLRPEQKVLLAQTVGYVRK